MTSHTWKQHETLVRSYLEFGFQKLSSNHGKMKKKKSQTPVLTFGGSGWAQGLGVVGKGGQESGWHKVMENSGSKARDSED